MSLFKISSTSWMLLYLLTCFAKSSATLSKRMLRQPARPYTLADYSAAQLSNLFHSDEMASSCPTQWINEGELPKTHYLTYAEENLVTLYDQVTVYVRMGASRAKDWLYEFLPVIAYDCPYIKEIVIDWWPEEPFPDRLRPYLTHQHDLPPQEGKATQAPAESEGPKVEVVQARALREFAVPVRFLPGKRGLAGRYDIGPLVSTEYALFLDDDRVYNCDAVRDMLIVAKFNPNRVVGHETRVLLECDSLPNVYQYANKRASFYRRNGRMVKKDVNSQNLMLPGATLIPVRMLYFFSKYVPPVIREFVNNELNCDDIYFNWALRQGLRLDLNDDGPIGVVPGDVESEEMDEIEKGPALDTRNRSNRPACYHIIRQFFPESYHLKNIERSVQVNIDARRKRM